MKKVNKKKGFTLIELIVVIAILGILAAIAVPRLTGFRVDAQKRAIEANLRTIDSAAAIYEANTGTSAAAAAAASAADDDGIDILIDADLLQARPVTTSVTYSINADGRGIVSIPVNTFGTHAVVTTQTVQGLRTVTGW